MLARLSLLVLLGLVVSYQVEGKPLVRGLVRGVGTAVGGVIKGVGGVVGAAAGAVGDVVNGAGQVVGSVVGGGDYVYDDYDGPSYVASQSVGEAAAAIRRSAPVSVSQAQATNARNY